MKKLLRSKANFEILEGFLSELLKEDIYILEVLDMALTALKLWPVKAVKSGALYSGS